MEQAPSRSRLLVAIALVLVAGVFTGAQLGKIAPLVPWYRDTLGFSLVATGWLTAVLGLFIAVAALPAGWLIERIGLVPTFRWSAAALAAGALGLAFAETTVAIFAARLVEALGYLGLCIGLPALLNTISPPSWRGPVLAIWSGFVPLGFASSDLLGLWLLPGGGQHVFLLVIALAFCVTALAALIMLPGSASASGHTGAQPSIRASLSLPVLLATLAFGISVVQSISALAFLPAYVAGPGSHYLVAAGVVALIVPVGNVLAGVLVAGRDGRFIALMCIAGYVVSGLVAVPAFGSASPFLATGAAILYVTSGALVTSGFFAAIPYVVPVGGSVAVVIGLICQAGGLGTVIGPPIAAAVIERLGYSGLGWYLLAISLLGAAVSAALYVATLGAVSGKARSGLPSGAA